MYRSYLLLRDYNHAHAVFQVEVRKTGSQSPLINLSKVHQNIFLYQLRIFIFQAWIKGSVVYYSLFKNHTVVSRRNLA